MMLTDELVQSLRHPRITIRKNVRSIRELLESWAIEPMNIFKLGKSKNDDEYGRIWVNTKGLGKTLGKIMTQVFF